MTSQQCVLKQRNSDDELDDCNEGMNAKTRDMKLVFDEVLCDSKNYYLNGFYMV